MSDKVEVLQVGLIEREEDRTLLYGLDPATGQIDHEYHLIAPIGVAVEIGALVDYEPCGVNFGWFKEEVRVQGADDTADKPHPCEGCGRIGGFYPKPEAE